MHDSRSSGVDYARASSPGMALRVLPVRMQTRSGLMVIVCPPVIALLPTPPVAAPAGRAFTSLHSPWHLGHDSNRFNCCWRERQTQEVAKTELRTRRAMENFSRLQSSGLKFHEILAELQFSEWSRGMFRQIWPLHVGDTPVPFTYCLV